MGNCKSRAVTEAVPEHDPKSVFQYDKDTRKIVYVGEDNIDSDISSSITVSCSRSHSVDNSVDGEGNVGRDVRDRNTMRPSNDGNPLQQKNFTNVRSLLGEIAEYLDEDESTIGNGSLKSSGTLTPSAASRSHHDSIVSVDKTQSRNAVSPLNFEANERQLEIPYTTGYASRNSSEMYMRSKELDIVNQIVKSAKVALIPSPEPQFVYKDPNNQYEVDSLLSMEPFDERQQGSVTGSSHYQDPINRNERWLTQPESDDEYSNETSLAGIEHVPSEDNNEMSYTNRHNLQNLLEYVDTPSDEELDSNEYKKEEVSESFGSFMHTSYEGQMEESVDAITYDRQRKDKEQDSNENQEEQVSVSFGSFMNASNVEQKKEIGSIVTNVAQELVDMVIFDGQTGEEKKIEIDITEDELMLFTPSSKARAVMNEMDAMTEDLMFFSPAGHVEEELPRKCIVLSQKRIVGGEENAMKKRDVESELWAAESPQSKLSDHSVDRIEINLPIVMKYDNTNSLEHPHESNIFEIDVKSKSPDSFSDEVFETSKENHTQIKDTQIVDRKIIEALDIAEEEHIQIEDNETVGRKITEANFDNPDDVVKLEATEKQYVQVEDNDIVDYGVHEEVDATNQGNVNLKVAFSDSDEKSKSLDSLIVEIIETVEEEHGKINELVDLTPLVDEAKEIIQEDTQICDTDAAFDINDFSQEDNADQEGLSRHAESIVSNPKMEEEKVIEVMEVIKAQVDIMKHDDQLQKGSGINEVDESIKIGTTFKEDVRNEEVCTDVEDVHHNVADKSIMKSITNNHVNEAIKIGPTVKEDVRNEEVRTDVADVHGNVVVEVIMNDITNNHVDDEINLATINKEVTQTDCAQIAHDDISFLDDEQMDLNNEMLLSESVSDEMLLTESISGEEKAQDENALNQFDVYRRNDVSITNMENKLQELESFRSNSSEEATKFSSPAPSDEGLMTRVKKGQIGRSSNKKPKAFTPPRGKPKTTNLSPVPLSHRPTLRVQVYSDDASVGSVGSMRSTRSMTSTRSRTPTRRLNGRSPTPTKSSLLRFAANHSTTPLSITPNSLPWDEKELRRERKTSPTGSISSANSNWSNADHKEESMKKSRRVAHNRAAAVRSCEKKTCSRKWNPTLFQKKKGCIRCIVLSSKKERQQYLKEGRHARIPATRGGCHFSCDRSKQLLLDHPDVQHMMEEDCPRLCRICFNALHR
jgi:hypothetical protein